MSAKKQEEKRRSVSIGGGDVRTDGGALIGGDVAVGKGGEFVGRDKITHTGPPPEGPPSREALIELLRQLSEQAARLEELEAWKRAELQGNLQTAEAMASAEEPPREELVDKLTRTQEMLEAAKGISTTAMGLLPLVARAIQWAGALF